MGTMLSFDHICLELAMELAMEMADADVGLVGLVGLVGRRLRSLDRVQLQPMHSMF